MTAANVTQVKSYQNTPVKQTGKKGSGADEFATVFEKNTKQTVNKNDAPAGTGIEDGKTQAKTDNADKAGKETDTAQRPDKTAQPVNSQKTDQTEDIQDTDELEKAAEKMAGAFMQQIEDLLTKMEDVLQVSREDILSAMDTLNMDMSDLMNPANMPKLAVALTEGADDFSLVTDENLFQNVKELMNQVNEMLSGFSDALQTTPQELTDILQNMPKQSMPQQTVEETVPEIQQPVQVLDETTQVRAAEAPKQEQSRDRGTENETFNFAQNVMEQLKTAVSKLTEPQTVSYTSDTQSIMDQMQEALKLTMKDDSTEMEMQLHPASLGNVHVQVASRDGVITASFTTQNETVKAALESQIVTLKENLNEQGIKVEAVEVTVASHAFERNLSDEGNTSKEQQNGKRKTVRRINLAELSDDFDETQMEEQDIIAADMMKKNGNTVDYTA